MTIKTVLYLIVIVTWMLTLSACGSDIDEDSKRGEPFERVDVPDNAYFDGVIAEQAIRELGVLSEGNTPFFLAVGFLKPHLPFNAPAKYWDLYDPAAISLAAFDGMPSGAPKEAQHQWGELRNYRSIPEAPEPVSEDMARKLRHAYYAATSYVDAQIGKVLQALDDLDLARDTIVVLMGDHGWSLGEHGLWCKHSLFDVATHTPLIIRAPGIVPGVANGLVEFVDIYPTLLDMTGTPSPAHLQGTSMLGMLRDPASPGKEAVFPRWKMAENGRTDHYSYTEFRAQDGTLISNMLYDSINDSDETVNLAVEPEHYAECAADILFTFVNALAQTEANREYTTNGGWLYQGDHLREVRIVSAQLPIIYDFVQPWLKEGGTAYDLASGELRAFDFEAMQDVFRTYIWLALNHGLYDSNWPALESPGLVHNILGLDDAQERIDTLPYFLSKDTEHKFEHWSRGQPSLKRIAKKFRNPGDVWPESLGYSAHVASNLVYVMTLFDRLDPGLGLGKRYRTREQTTCPMQACISSASSAKLNRSKAA